MTEKHFSTVDVAVCGLNPRSVAVAIYLQEIANPQSTNVALAMEQFIAHCSLHQIHLHEIEYGLNNDALVRLLIAWCQRQSDARYMIIRQAICDMVGNDSVTDEYLLAAISIATNLDGSLDFLQD